VTDWTVEMKVEDESFLVSWILLYRASISGYKAADFHQACDGMGKCIVFIKAENGRIAAAYNEDGFTSVAGSYSPNRRGFIVSVNEDGGVGEIFRRNDQFRKGIWNYSRFGPMFGNIYSSDSSDLFISSDCNLNEDSYSILGNFYGQEGSLNRHALFGQEEFTVIDYEVFKIVI
jgi:hypothetical protein